MAFKHAGGASLVVPSAATSISGAAAGTVAVGDLVCFGAMFSHTNGARRCLMTDQLGNKYPTIFRRWDNNANEAWVQFAGLVQFAGTPTFTLNFFTYGGVAAQVGDGMFVYWCGSGFSLVIPLDGQYIPSPIGQQDLPGTGTDAVIGAAFTPRYPGCTIIGMGGNYGALRADDWTAGTGFTKRFAHGAVDKLSGAVEDLTQGGAASQAVKWTVANNEGRYTAMFIAVPNSASLSPRSITTSFPATENPISEAGKWSVKGADGAGKWGNCKTSGGVARGVSTPFLFGDPTALLGGPWSGKLNLKGTLVGIGVAGECELRFCSNITNMQIVGDDGDNWGYEVYISTDPLNRYYKITRWNGAIGQFTILHEIFTGVAVVDGDIMEAEYDFATHTIAMYLTQSSVRTLKHTETVGEFGLALPGIGFAAGVDADFNNFGFSDFSINDLFVPTSSMAYYTRRRRKLFGP